MEHNKIQYINVEQHTESDETLTILTFNSHQEQAFFIFRMMLFRPEVIFFKMQVLLCPFPLLAFSPGIRTFYAGNTDIFTGNTSGKPTK